MQIVLRMGFCNKVVRAYATVAAKSPGFELSPEKSSRNVASRLMRGPHSPISPTPSRAISGNARPDYSFRPPFPPLVCLCGFELKCKLPSEFFCFPCGPAFKAFCVAPGFDFASKTGLGFAGATFAFDIYFS